MFSSSGVTFVYPMRSIGLSLFVLRCVLCFGSAAEDSFPYLTGADLSALPVYEAAGAVYRDAGGEKGDALHILAEAGMRCARLRLFVEPNMEGVVTNNLAYTLELAGRCQAAGLEILLDLHYSDTWADPSKQFIPVAWLDLPLDALREKVSEYTRQVFESFIAAGIRVHYVQLGNEITNGMLWPVGRVEFGGDPEQEDNWDAFASLLDAAHHGLEQAFAGAPYPLPLRLHHIECTGDLARTDWYLGNLKSHGVPFDAVAFSYYPEWHGTIPDLEATLRHSIAMTGKPVVVVETAYPWHPDPEEKTEGSFPYPLTPEGQGRFLCDVELAVRGLDSGMGRGVIYWHPESLRMDAPFHIWKWGRYALFGFDGKLLPSVRCLLTTGEIQSGLTETPTPYPL